MQKIKLLGISASPRKDGNSQYLLRQAMGLISETFPGMVESEEYSFAGKKMSGCIACFKCLEVKNCIIKDDFHELRDKWFEADAIIYSVPVYHMGIPSQLKAFVDRLGNSLAIKFLESGFPRFLKAVGVLSQGGCFFAGQEQVINTIINHAVLMRCIPVPGDPWQSYLGAGGWCRMLEFEKDGLMRLHQQGEEDALVLITAAKSVARRVVEMAMVLKGGVAACREQFSKNKDNPYSLFLSRLESKA